MWVTRPGLGDGWAAAPYEGVAKQLIHELKASGSGVVGRALAEPLAGLLAQVCAATPAPGGPVALVPAPSGRAATRRRGFAPAQLLATHVARAARSLGLAVRVVPAVRFVGEVRDQSLLSKAERAMNMAGSMAFVSHHAGLLAASRVVLFDDIVTTGATLGELRQCLVLAGVNPVSFLCFAETL